MVVVPGFLASDAPLLLLRHWLKIMGYRPQTAGFRFSVDCAEQAVERVEELCEALHATTGRRIAIVGHSRGGHLARATAARRPDLVSHAISMGADLQGLLGISTPTRPPAMVRTDKPAPRLWARPQTGRRGHPSA